MPRRVVLNRRFNNTTIISGSYDETIRIWDLNTGRMLQELSNDSRYLTPFKTSAHLSEFLRCIEINGELYHVVGMRRLSFGTLRRHGVTRVPTEPKQCQL